MKDPYMPEPSDLDTRDGLPADLSALLKRYPREDWQDHANLGATATFWLSRHDMFRELGGQLAGALSQYREGTVDLDGFRHWFAPRLQFFLQQLEHHHQIEDDHYFPVFQRAEPKLARGFDLLDGDHHLIHHDLVAVADGASGLLSVARPVSQPIPSDAELRAADVYGEASERLLKRLTRHLIDEEDLIIPLILDRGEASIGI